MNRFKDLTFIFDMAIVIIIALMLFLGTAHAGTCKGGLIPAHNESGEWICKPYNSFSEAEKYQLLKKLAEGNYILMVRIERKIATCQKKYPNDFPKHGQKGKCDYLWDEYHTYNTWDWPSSGRIIE